MTTTKTVPVAEALFAETEALAKSQFEAEGVEPSKVKFLRFGKFRYQNQEHTTEVLLGDGEVTDVPLLRRNRRWLADDVPGLVNECVP